MLPANAAYVADPYQEPRSFIGINVQFIHNSKIVIFTLSAVELHILHTAANLKKVIFDEFEKWNISPS